jgi:3-oxoacyl-[acyl-carrier-protein] synthase-1
MKRAVITGLGFITSIGNSYAAVLESLRSQRTGIELFPPFAAAEIPVKLAGTIKDFRFPSADFEDWEFPGEYRLRREQLRAMTPNSLYAYCSMFQAIKDARLEPSRISNPATGLMCASGGSMWLAYENLRVMLERGVQFCPPMGIVNSIPGSLYINLSSCFRIRGAVLGFSSACSSSAHALGTARDLVALGRQETVFVVGAEDCNLFNILPFASIRALSVQTDPQQFPCPFDVRRDGFVGTGGGVTLVVEELDQALKRGARIYAEILGWGQTSDGYNVVAPEPNGEGLARAMELALADAGVGPHKVDYINAHATGTTIGDAAEIHAIRKVFGNGRIPHVSSTKALTGHGLSLAGAMEAGFCCVAMEEGFIPVSAHIRQLDPVCEGIPVVTSPVNDTPRLVMKNSSGFGGANVCILLRKYPE